MKSSWKTTACGLVAAAASFAIANPALFVKWPWVVTVAGFVVTGGLAGVGIFAKDSTVHSTSDQVQTATVDKKAADIKAIQ